MGVANSGMPDGIQRKKLVPRLNSMKQKDWIKACEILGLWIAPGGGKGSHSCGYISEGCDRTNSDNLVITIQKNNLHPIIQKKLFQKLLIYGNSTGAYTEDDIWKSLKILK